MVSNAVSVIKYTFIALKSIKNKKIQLDFFLEVDFSGLLVHYLVKNNMLFLMLNLFIFQVKPLNT